MADKVILVTDDDPDDRLFLIEALGRRMGQVTVIEASDGQEAMDFLQASTGKGDRVDLVILDMNMPVMSGLEALEQLREIPALLYTPVVMLSTGAEPQLVKQAYKSGVNSYMKKPSCLGKYDEIAAALQTCFLDLK